MTRFQDLTGKKFGLLTVVKRAANKVYPSGYSCACWECIDQSGNVKYLTSKDLKRGQYNLDRNLHRPQAKHCEPNKYPKRLIRVFQGMKNRCYNPNHSNYHNYGGRGIAICDEWLNDSSKFYEWALENGYNKDSKIGECTIDRINESGNYEPNNCRWVNAKTQGLNLRKNVNLTLNGETHCISEWARILNIPKSSLQYKVKKGKINEILK